eukprot:6193366-Pleurochrysis_carterae.AAC.2
MASCNDYAVAATCQSSSMKTRRNFLFAAATILSSPALFTSPSPTLALSNEDALRLEAQSRNAEGVLLPSGVRVIDVLAGSGPMPSPGAKVYVHFKIWTDGFDRGQPVDASYFQVRPVDFILGSGGGGRVVAGLDQGVAGMREGGWRRLVLPPSLGYGDAGVPRGVLSNKAVPPGATLYVDTHLVDGGTGKCEPFLASSPRLKSLSCERGKP